MDCIFCQIIRGERSAEKVCEDEKIVVLNDLHPRAPIHQLIIPKKHIPTLNDLSEQDTELAGLMLKMAGQLAERAGIAQSGYRTVLNCNSDGGQVIFHIHLHLLGGRSLQWPPG